MSAREKKRRREREREYEWSECEEENLCARPCVCVERFVTFRKIVLFFKIIHVTRDFAKGLQVLDNRRRTRADVKSKYYYITSKL